MDFILINWQKIHDVNNWFPQFLMNKKVSTCTVMEEKKFHFPNLVSCPPFFLRFLAMKNKIV